MAGSFWHDLVERRVPHYLAIYLGGSWAVVEFFAFLEDRFLLSPHLTNLVLLLLVLVLPSVLLFTYNHGRRGRDRWGRIEKVAIPVNVALAMVVLFAGFSGKELGAVTTTVTVEDEDGNAVRRTVPKGEFRKRAAFFPLNVGNGGDTVAWLGAGVMHALTLDLFQEMFLDMREPSSFQEELVEAGFPDARNVPDPLKRRIAGDLHLGFYVDGEAARTADGYRISLALHDADRARLVAEHAYRGPDLLALVDSASLQLRRDLEIPARHIEESTDVPVAEILTGSVDALRLYTEAIDHIRIDGDYAAGLEALNAALEMDPGFATGHFARYQTLVLSGDAASAGEAVRRAMEYGYRLPERLQYAVKAEWFAMQGDVPRSFATYEMWAELYPQDSRAQLTVAQIRQIQNDRRGAIDRLERVLELDPTQLELLQRIGTLYEELAEPDRALAYYDRYAEANPEDRNSFTSLAGVHRRRGDHVRARELYDQALLLAPEDVELGVEVATFDRDVGAFEEAMAGLEAALAAARTPQQRFLALRGLSRLHEYRGAYREAVRYLEAALDEGRSFQPPIVQVQMRLVTLDTYVRGGRTETALGLLASLSAQLPPPMDALVPVGEIGIYEALGDTAALAAAVEAGKAMLERVGMNSLAQPVAWGEGRLHEMRGEWEKARAAYERERALNPVDPTIPLQLGRCYRAQGELRRARSLVLETLESRPSFAPAHLELARISVEEGREREAIGHLERALETWAPADPGYEPAREARELLASLGG